MNDDWQPSEAYMAHVRRVVDEAPPLTAQQRDRIRRILAPVLETIAREALAQLGTADAA